MLCEGEGGQTYTDNLKIIGGKKGGRQGQSESSEIVEDERVNKSRSSLALSLFRNVIIKQDDRQLAKITNREKPPSKGKNNHSQ